VLVVLSQNGGAVLQQPSFGRVDFESERFLLASHKESSVA